MMIVQDNPGVLSHFKAQFSSDGWSRIDFGVTVPKVHTAAPLVTHESGDGKPRV
ncbi:MAG: hypothetical protein GY762_16415 [Proteobacteria bacterium]|nr:hypothetical protein [Pseudomonadota bacterium]